MPLYSMIFTAMAESFVAAGNKWNLGAFQTSKFGLDLGSFEATHIYNSPNLSIFPLLAYHKICNDHYRNEKWQPFEPWTCNIDYLRPQDNMNAHSFISDSLLKTPVTSILDLENSNLPIDYFTSVLPRAQYGDESVAPVSVDGANSFFKLQDPNNTKIGPVFSGSSKHATDNLIKSPDKSVEIAEGNVAPVQTLYTNQLLIGLKVV